MANGDDQLCIAELIYDLDLMPRQARLLSCHTFVAGVVIRCRPAPERPEPQYKSCFCVSVRERKDDHWREGKE